MQPVRGEASGQQSKERDSSSEESEEESSMDSSDSIDESSDASGLESISGISDRAGKLPKRVWDSDVIEVEAGYVLASDEEWATDDDEDDMEQEVARPQQSGQSAEGAIITLMSSAAGADPSQPSDQEPADANTPLSAAEGTLKEDDKTPVEKAQAEKNAALHAANQHMSPEEQQRARDVFRHCDARNEGFIDEYGAGTALSLLGIREPEENISALFKRREVDLLDESAFLVMLGDLRSLAVDEEQLSAIEGAFSDLYYGTLQSKESQFVVEQRDALGRPYILAEDLRSLLVTHGDILLDEEADRLILDCKPVYTTEASGRRVGRIFFDQYRAMLLPGPIL